MRQLLLVGFLILTNTAHALDHTYKSWSEMLNQYLNKNGQVDYKQWSAHQEPLDKFLKSLEGVSFQDYNKFSNNEKKAFLINSYNGFTIKLILKNYPVASIKKIGGLFSSPWKIEFFNLLGGKIKSLDPIEHEWLRKQAELKDPRVHAAVNCASISCPQLFGEAFQGSIIDEQLDRATKAWINDASRNKFTQSSAEISKIFSWFQDDFGGNEQGVINFASKYLPSDLANHYKAHGPKVSFLDYDWDLNKQ